MKKTLVASSALATVLAMSPMAQAQNLYGSFFGGVNLLGEVESEDFAPIGFPGYSYDIEFDTGFVIGAALGTELANGLRVEGEIAFRGNDLDQLTVNTPLGPLVYDIEGDAETLSLMANAWYDFELGGGGFQPYVGGGVGFATVDIDDEDDSVFAFQVGAGVSFPLSGQIAITGDYRFFMVTDPNYFGIDFSVPGQHTFMVGARVPF